MRLSMRIGLLPTARPGYGDVYWSLANLKTYRFDGRRVRFQCYAAESSPSTSVVDRYHLCFALGKALEDSRRYEESFGFYERGNALKRADSRYHPEMIELNTRLQIEVCTPELFARGTSGIRCCGSHLHCWPAPLGVDLAGADSGVALRGGGYAGAG